MSAAAHIEEVTNPVALAALCGSAGFYVSFDETPDVMTGDWEGPFETQQAAIDYAKSIIEAAAVASIKSMFK